MILFESVGMGRGTVIQPNGKTDDFWFSDVVTPQHSQTSKLFVFFFFNQNHHAAVLETLFMILVFAAVQSHMCDCYIGFIRPMFLYIVHCHICY